MSATAVTDTTEEVRLAMAWNGGVSLAIWMGGAAVELDTARRAHLGPQDDTVAEPDPAHPRGWVSKLFRKAVGALTSIRKSPPAAPSPEVRRVYNAIASTFDRRLVIDILAGASAGGINGALLAAAIAKRAALGPTFLRKRWLAIGDFSALLRPVNETKPPSLMRGDYFHEQLHDVFVALTDGSASATGEPISDDLDTGVVLDIQTTNVLGSQRSFADSWGQSLYAREYRAPLKFRKPEHFTADALAAGARASASFPAAFEPFALMNKGAERAGFGGVKRWAIDGGLLENAPIRPAIELIPTRANERPVRRFVCYVNAAPAVEATDKDDPDEPRLRSVLADVINLPRDGRFVDQLIAIQHAVNRPAAARNVVYGLLELDAEHLKPTAEALLGGYAESRTGDSLRAIVAAAPTDAGATAVAEIIKALGGKRLPWIPSSLDAPSSAREWQWGVRGAQRVLLLELDVLRRLAGDDKVVEWAIRRDALGEFRQVLNGALARLEDANDRLLSSPAIQAAVLALRAEPERMEERLDDLDALTVGYRCEAYDAVSRGARAVYEALARSSVDRATEDMRILFGQSKDGTYPSFSAQHLAAFLERALCIEVVRRAFTPDQDLEPAQALDFVQLTPLAPARVFVDHPLRDEGPNTGRKKLTGLDLGHFSAFYRRSWRANDYMWGRLDAATRIVDMLVSAARYQYVVHPAGSGDRLEQLVAVLVPSDETQEARDLRRLAKEALDDAKLPAPRLSRAVVELAAPATADETQHEALRALLQTVVEADLNDPDNGGFFTRVVCSRAAQYEVLRQELQPLAQATADDGKLGCFTKPLQYDPADGDLAFARSLMAGVPLPEKLGSRDADEKTSTLAVRTMSHASLVAISSLKTLGVPLGGTFGILRAPFLSLAGITAEKARNRAAALLAFVAASFYLTTRAITASAGESPKLGDAWSLSTIATLTAALTVVALVALPAWRAYAAAKWPRKRRQAGWAIALFCASGVAAMLIAFKAVGFGNALTSTGGFSLPKWLAYAVIAAPLGAAATIRLLRLPSFGERRLAKLSTRPGVTALATAVVGVLLMRQCLPTLRSTVGIGAALGGIFSGGNWHDFIHLLGSPTKLWQAIKDNWRSEVVIATYASVPVAALYGLHGYVARVYDLIRAKTLLGHGAARLGVRARSIRDLLLGRSVEGPGREPV